MMPDPMSEERLAEIEAQHVEQDGDCAACGISDGRGPWPCDAAALVAEVRRLRAALEDCSQFSDDYGLASAALGRPRI